jgi:hypothetical protein
VQRVEQPESRETARQGAAERQQRELHIGQGEENQAGEERRRLAEGHRVGLDAAAQVAVEIPHFLVQVSGREGQAEEEGERRVAPVQRSEQRGAEQEMQSTAGEMDERAEHGDGLCRGRGERVEDAAGGDGQGEPQRARTQQSEQREADCQEGRGEPADGAPADALRREDSRDLVAVVEIGVDSGPIVEDEDMRHEQDVGGGEYPRRGEPPCARRAHRVDGAEERRALQHENVAVAYAGEEAANGHAACPAPRRRAASA